MFRKNEGTIDRILRVVIGVALLIGFLVAPAEAGYRPWLLIGIIPLATGLIGWCPAYSIFGIKTCRMKES